MLTLKLLQCYGIFLTSLNLTCTKMKNTSQPCDNSAHQRMLQETFHTLTARWGRDPGISFPYAKTQDNIFHSHTTDVSLSWNNLLVKIVSRRDQFIDLFHKSIYWSLHDTSSHQMSFDNIL